MNREGTSNSEINGRSKPRGYATWSTSIGVLWKENETRRSKNVFITKIKGITTYGCEVWRIKEKNTTLEMDFWCRSARI
jgi:hypothetical protein